MFFFLMKNVSFLRTFTQFLHLIPPVLVVGVSKSTFRRNFPTVHSKFLRCLDPIKSIPEFVVRSKDCVDVVFPYKLDALNFSEFLRWFLQHSMENHQLKM